MYILNGIISASTVYGIETLRIYLYSFSLHAGKVLSKSEIDKKFVYIIWCRVCVCEEPHAALCAKKSVLFLLGCEVFIQLS